MQNSYTHIPPTEFGWEGIPRISVLTHHFIQGVKPYLRVYRGGTWLFHTSTGKTIPAFDPYLRLHEQGGGGAGDGAFDRHGVAAQHAVHGGLGPMDGDGVERARHARAAVVVERHGELPPTRRASQQQNTWTPGAHLLNFSIYQNAASISASSVLFKPSIQALHPLNQLKAGFVEW
jgi:hypothetical protein